MSETGEHTLPWEWIDTGEVVDANNECVVECEDEQTGTMIATGVNCHDELVAALKTARTELNTQRHALKETIAWGKEEGLGREDIGQAELASRDRVISQVDAAIARAESRA